jgi:ATP-binding cassette subfamily B (MDR/TAP) protein 1
MRARYLRAVLRQDMEYFDLRAGLASEVVASLSSDSLAVQDVLSERVPNLVANATMFVGSYAVAFALVWRLALATLPSALLLVVPGVLVCGRGRRGICGFEISVVATRCNSKCRKSIFSFEFCEEQAKK